MELTVIYIYINSSEFCFLGDNDSSPVDGGHPLADES